MRRGWNARRTLAAVRAAIKRDELIPPGSRVLVACSGGPDSTALLHILAELGRTFPFEVAVAHFNHRLRPSADEDERFVRETARSLGLHVAVGRRDVRGHARSGKLNLEEAARSLRYAFLDRAAARLDAALIATGHTLNDQAETLLMRLLRGSGLRGLAGISPSLEGRIIRPLLDVPRSAVMAFLRERCLSFREDETNRDRSLLRNRVRLGLVPYLERHFEPRAVEALGRSARIIQDDDAVLDAAARRVYVRLSRGSGAAASLDARGLARVPAGLGRRVVRAYLAELRGDLRRLTFDDVEAVRTLDPGAVRVLPGGLRLGRDAGSIRPARPSPPAARSFSLTWDGRSPLDVPGCRWILRGRRVRRKPTSVDFDDRTRAYCDAAALRLPLTVSSRKPGDRYRPLGRAGSKKLKEILRAKGISRVDREILPVVRSEREIVWVPGLPVGERFKVDAGTRSVVVIEAVRRSGPPVPARRPDQPDR